MTTKPKTYRLTQEHYNWLNQIYPVVNENWRDFIKTIYFKSHYNTEEREELLYLTNYFEKDEGIDWTPKIKKREYLGKRGVMNWWEIDTGE